MCLITAVPKGVSKKGSDLAAFIRSGMSSNTHGSGYAYKKKGENIVHLSKGYLTSKAIIDAIDLEDLNDDDELIIHHRIGTSGLQESFNTHPFFVSTDEEVVKTIEGALELPVMAHNGIISEFSDYSSDYNDTFLFVQNFIALPGILKQLKEDPKLFKKRYNALISGEKLAFLFPDREMVLLGNFVEDDGYYHSNTGYKRYTYDAGGSSDDDIDFSGRGQNRSETVFWDQLQERREEQKKLKSLITEPEDENFQEGDAEFTPLEEMNFGAGDSTNSSEYDYPVGDGSDDPGFPFSMGFERNNSRVVNTILDSDGNLMSNKKQLNGLKFTGSTIRITSKNYSHFSLVPTVDVNTRNYGANGVCKANKLYSLIDYDENAPINYIVEKYGEQEMFFLNVNETLKWFNVYVSHDFRDKYVDLQKFINAHMPYNKGKSSLSLSMVKKLNKTLSRIGPHTQYIKFKEHGWFFKDDIQHLIDISLPHKNKHDYGKIADELIRNAVITTPAVELSMSPEFNEFADTGRFD